jgi:TRAP transporter 4TM/12TM fusion protein
VRSQRQLSGVSAAIARALLVLITLTCLVMVLDIAGRFGRVMHGPQYLALVHGLAAVYVFLKYPLRQGSAMDRVPWYDWLQAVVAAGVSGYVVLMYGDIIYQLSTITTPRVILGSVALAVAFEITRRCSGWALVIAVAVFLVYALSSEYFPGVLYTRSTSWPRLATFLYLDPTSLYGIALEVIAGVVFAFVLFGNFLFAWGGGKFLTDMALQLMGRYRGGPAKMSVVCSGLFGTMTGSAAANAVFVGMVSIPLMKRIGYPPAFAGAVEAVASSGGLLMPPVMGAAAFLMAEFLKVPYSDIALAAALPAVLYYVALFLEIDLEAQKLGLKGLAGGTMAAVLKQWRSAVLFVIPLIALIYLLFFAYMPAESSVIYATVVLFVAAIALDRSRLNFKFFHEIIEKTGRDLIEPAAISALAGLILGVVTLTGLGSSMSQGLIMISGESLIVLLIVTALVNIVLGMGLPAVAIYILLSVIVGPALVNFGVDPIAAHLFIFYFGVMSYVTPPMAFACFITGPMAGASPFRTGIEGMRLGAAAYIVPFVFVYRPELLLKGSWQDVVLVTIVALLGIACLSVAIIGYLFRPLNWAERAVAAGAMLLLMWPGSVTDLAGAALMAVLVLWLWLSRSASDTARYRERSRSAPP